MANARALMTAGLAGSLQNGGGGGAPARSEVSPYLMENMFTEDRRAVWLAALGTGGSFNVDIDLLSAQDVSHVFLHNLQMLSNPALPNVGVYSTGTYPAGPWTARGSVVNLVPTAQTVRRDFCVTFGTVNARYWRLAFNWTAGGAMTVLLGQWKLGVPIAALPRSPGESISTEPNKLVVRTLDQQPVVYYKGGVVGGGRLSAEMVTDADLAGFRALGDRIGLLSMLDADGQAYQLLAGETKVRSEYVADDTSGLWTVDLSYEVLP